MATVLQRDSSQREREREMEWEAGGRRNSWPSLEHSEFKRQWAEDTNYTARGIKSHILGRNR